MSHHSQDKPTAAFIRRAINEADQRCQHQGARLTDKRKQVLETLLGSSTPLSAYELADHCREQHGNSIPAMSVYRILGFLQEQHLVHKLNLANKYVACAHITCDHDHGVPQFLICSACHRVKEISVNKSTIKALQRSVDDAGFHLLSEQLEIDCLCAGCVSKPG